MPDQTLMRPGTRISTLPGGALRVIWGEAGGPGGVVQFYPKEDGVVLDYIRVRQGNHTFGATLFVEALRAAGIPQPRFVESSPIVNVPLLTMLKSGGAADLARAQRFWHIQSLVFAKAIGATLVSSELVKNARGNWIARGQLSY